MRGLSGTVKFFDTRRGYGFLAAPDGTDVFVHHSRLPGRGSGRAFLRRASGSSSTLPPAAAAGRPATSGWRSRWRREDDAVLEVEPEFGDRAELRIRRHGRGGPISSSQQWSSFCRWPCFGLAVWLFWHHGIGWFDLGLGSTLYVITGWASLLDSTASSRSGVSGPDEPCGSRSGWRVRWQRRAL